MQAGDLLFEVGEECVLNTYVFVREEIAPGATQPTWIVRKKGSQDKIRVSVGFYSTSPAETYRKYILSNLSGVQGWAASLSKDLQQLESAISKLQRAFGNYAYTITNGEDKDV
jgi:hypothetical protein